MASESCDANETSNGTKRRDDDRSASGTESRQCMTVAERLRLYRERQEMIQRKGIETLKEMDARAEEFRRKQVQDKRRSIKEARTKEEEQRANVEERRRKILEEEHERRLLKLQKIWENNRRTDESRRRKRKKAGGRLSLSSGAMSDGTLSSGGRTPTRPYRPHSIAGQLPNYALPTVASQIRSATWGTEPGLKGRLVTVCYRCRTQATNIEFDYSTPRKRSRSAEPVPRSGHLPYRIMVADHTVSRDVSPLLSRPLRSSRTNASAGSVFPSSIPTLQKSPSASKSAKTPTNSRSNRKSEMRSKEEEREEERSKRKSFLPHRKCQSARRPREHSAEFRLFSFRHQGDTASMTVTRGTKTSTRSNVETFQQSKMVKPGHDDLVTSHVCPETGKATKRPPVVPPLLSLKDGRRSRISKPDDGSGQVVAKDTNSVAMETGRSVPKRRSIIKHLMTTNGSEASSKTLATKGTVARQRSSNIPVAKIERPKELPSKLRHHHDDDARQQHLRDAHVTDDGGHGGDAWPEDGANSETISDGASLDLFLEDSTSMSETTDDLNPSRKSSDVRRGLVQMLPFSDLLKNRDELLEGDEETVEIYEEFQVLEELEVLRGGGKELIVTLEKIVTEETIELFCRDHEDDDDLDSVLRASVSSI